MYDELFMGGPISFSREELQGMVRRDLVVDIGVICKEDSSLNKRDNWPYLQSELALQVTNTDVLSSAALSECKTRINCFKTL